MVARRLKPDAEARSGTVRCRAARATADREQLRATQQDDVPCSSMRDKTSRRPAMLGSPNPSKPVHDPSLCGQRPNSPIQYLIVSSSKNPRRTNARVETSGDFPCHERFWSLKHGSRLGPNSKISRSFVNHAHRVCISLVLFQTTVLLSEWSCAHFR